MVAAWFNQKWVHAEPGQLVCGCVPMPEHLWQGDSAQCCALLQQDQRSVSKLLCLRQLELLFYIKKLVCASLGPALRCSAADPTGMVCRSWRRF